MVLGSEKGIESGADLIVLQEAYEGSGCVYQMSHPGYILIREERTMLAVGVDTSIQMDDLGESRGKGDVQVFEVTDKIGVEVTVLNVYNQTCQSDNERTSTRPAKGPRRDELLSAKNVVICGDFNTHSPMWNEKCSQRRDSSFLEGLVEQHNLQIINNGQTTWSTIREGKHIESIIDITLARGQGVEDISARTMIEETEEIGSDDTMIEVEWGRKSPNGTSQKITGGNIDGMQVEDSQQVKEEWQRWSGDRKILSNESTVSEVEEEAVAIREHLTDVLNQRATMVRICVRSKRWWNGNIAEKRGI